jgi:hypothetical protein
MVVKPIETIFHIKKRFIIYKTKTINLKYFCSVFIPTRSLLARSLTVQTL